MTKRLCEDNEFEADVVEENEKPPTKKRQKKSTAKANETNNVNKDVEQPTNSKSSKPRLQLHLLSCGYMRKYLTSRNINLSDIAQIVAMLLFEDWKFDYCHDYDNRGPTRHGIENNGKTLKCNCDNDDTCACFYSTFSIGMKPKSGIYKIKFKIGKIDNTSYGSIVGIISQNRKNKYNSKHLSWYSRCNDFIGWSACDKNSYLLQNGLYCGLKLVRQNNIFVKNNFIYVSNNKNYQQRLPNIKNGDTLVLRYNSDKSILSFSKENDKCKLDSYIKNLPKDETFCWFVGHGEGEMCLTVID